MLFSGQDIYKNNVGDATNRGEMSGCFQLFFSFEKYIPNELNHNFYTN